MKKIKELEDKIIKARNAYYNKTSIVSDAIYDVWIDELAKLDPKNPQILGIGAEPVSEWKKYTHEIEMGSLNKCQTAEEFFDWKNKYALNDDLFLTLKLDGLSISLDYENGKFKQAVTRGSGKIGEIISQNVVKMIGVPLILSEKITSTIRGEVLLSKENHKKYFPDYSNTRNAASGISRRYDGDGSDKLTILSYAIYSDDLVFKTQEDQFQKLKQLGFEVPAFYVVKSIKEIENIKQQYVDDLRNVYDFDLDGLVIHNNNLVKQEEHGSLHGRKRASIAYKFDAVSKEAYISEIIQQIGNSGRITPVAVFNPKVNLVGADIERASLHNFANIEELGIDVGCKVLVCRSNDVIPYITEVSEATGTIFKRPTNCPDCDAKLEERGEYIQCPNTFGCKSQIIGAIDNWISSLNVLEWGNALITRLVEAKLITNITDLYKLTIDQLASIERMGEKSAAKCHKILWENTNISLDLFLGSLSIPNVGVSTIKMAMDAGFDTFDKILSASKEDLLKIKGMGPVKCEFMFNGLKQNKDLIKELLSLGITIKEKNMNGKLVGKNICITGSTNVKRDDLKKIIIDNGGTFKSNISKDCTHLIIADPSSTTIKANGARNMGIALISEEQFFNMIE